MCRKGQTNLSLSRSCSSRDQFFYSTIQNLIIIHFRSDPQKTEPFYDDDEEEEEILGSDDDEQEDPKDYCKGKAQIFMGTVPFKRNKVLADNPDMNILF